MTFYDLLFSSFLEILKKTKNRKAHFSSACKMAKLKGKLQKPKIFFLQSVPITEDNIVNKIRQENKLSK